MTQNERVLFCVYGKWGMLFKNVDIALAITNTKLLFVYQGDGAKMDFWPPFIGFSNIRELKPCDKFDYGKGINLFDGKMTDFDEKYWWFISFGKNGNLRDKFINTLQTAMAKNYSEIHSSSPQPIPENLAEQIKKLKDLHNYQVLTDDEYRAAMKRLGVDL